MGQDCYLKNDIDEAPDGCESHAEVPREHCPAQEADHCWLNVWLVLGKGPHSQQEGVGGAWTQMLEGV